MGGILMVATVAVAAGNAVVLRLLRSAMGLVQSAGAAAMIAAGGYLIWYYRAAW
jgi:hypothetical protein